ncbi:MAG TPA: D-sedoheptulose 7-phosphate isomerase [Micropepsaceae bacterium]|nr:D-sedoheptulose 7-phosphate isomerase [Micropepsaceae bacterium]
MDGNEAARRIRNAFAESSGNYAKLCEEAEAIAEIALKIVERMRRGGKLMFCGNGGSAADAQHLAAELQGRYLRERSPLAAIALTANTSTLTAVGNDYGYGQVFARQVRALGKPEDVLIAISTSGNSRNVIEALEVAKAIGMFTVGLTGASGGAVRGICDALIRVPSDRTPRIQEMHIGVGHMICEIIEDCLV